MINALACHQKYGLPNEAINKGLIKMWDVPAHLELGVFPKRIYCNVDLVGPLHEAMNNCIGRCYVEEIVTWDGCYNQRVIRGYEDRYKDFMRSYELTKDSGFLTLSMKLLSLHSWAVAIDINASTNLLGAKPTLSAGLVKCFTDAGFDWGGTWKRPDGMHFQLKNI